MAGWALDRFDRRRLMIGDCVLRGAVFASIPVTAVFVRPAAGATRVVAFDAASYLIMAFSLWPVRDVRGRVGRPARRCGPSARDARRGAGFRAVARLAATNAVLRDTTIMFALFNVGEGALLVFLPHRALLLGLGTGGYGYLVAAGTTGNCSPRCCSPG